MLCVVDFYELPVCLCNCVYLLNQLHIDIDLLYDFIDLLSIYILLCTYVTHINI